MGDDKSDIVLDESWTRVIRNLAVTTAKGEDSDITLMPKWATINLGGGGGENSDGDLKWHNKDGDRLIHFTAEASDAFDDTRIFAEGEYGRLRLGGAGTFGTLDLADQDGGRAIEIEAHGPHLALYGEDEDTHVNPGWISTERVSTSEISVHGSMTASSGLVRELELGGGAPEENIYEPGKLTLWDSDGNDSVVIDGDGGSIQFNGQAPSDGGRPDPMMYMFTGGRSNPTQSVIAHSPRWSKWGLRYEDEGDKMVFESGGSPVLTADLGGEKVGIGTDEPDHALHVDGEARGTTEWAKISDARCKQNVEPLSGALDTVQRLQGVSYEWDEEWASDHEVDDSQQVGFVAQEVEEVLPEAVLEGEDGLRATTQGAVTPVLVEAVKEQQDTIDEQRDTIESQQAVIDEQAERLGELESRLERLESAVADQPGE